MAGIDANWGGKRAREAREALGLHPMERLPCLLSVVEDRAGVPVVIRRLPPDVAGACFRDGDRAVLWVNGDQPPVRQRFTLAHELAHAWCRHDAAGVDTVKTLGGQTTDAREIQANAFAAEFLVPRGAIEEVIEGQPTLEELVVIAAHYGVSAWVVLFRCQTARVVGDARAERLRAEIEDGLHLEVQKRLALPAVEDRLAAIHALPYISPALEGSALAAMLGGEASIDAAAAAADCDRGALQAAVASLASR